MIVITFLQAATREGKHLERVVMEALDKCSRSSPVTTGDTVITRAEHQLGYCTALYCTVLYCTVLYCTVLYCTDLEMGTMRADTE